MEIQDNFLAPQLFEIISRQMMTSQNFLGICLTAYLVKVKIVTI